MILGVKMIQNRQEFYNLEVMFTITSYTLSV